MWQPVLMINGYILSILGLIMLIPAALDILVTLQNWSPFITSSMICLFFGFTMFLANYMKIERINLKQGYLITVTSWVLVCLFSSIPFFLNHSVLHQIDAFFEAISGITGTGATIMNDVESLPQSVLLWRSLLNYIGGLGIVIFAVALLPFLGIGGMQMFQRENSDSNDKFMPKFSYIAKRILFVYLLLTALASGALFLCGMNWFDAINHAMSAIGTGGFSTKNDSIAYYDSPSIEVATMIFMFLGALPMTFYILLLRGQQADMNRQVRVFCKCVAICILLICAYLYVISKYSLLESLRYVSFTVIAIVTTTGLTSFDYTSWGMWATAVILFLSLIGGCTGSTCGSIKIFRWQVVYAFLRKYFLSALDQHRIVPLKIGNMAMPDSITISVFVYVFSFIMCLVFLSLCVSFCGYDFQTSFSAVVACITNVGVGSTGVIGPHGNYAFFSSTAKGILCFAMLLGRLEVVTVLVVLSRLFWRR